MTTFTWIINGLQVVQSPEPNTVVISNFTINGEEDGLNAYVTYAVNLLPADPQSFIPFNEITQADAVQWTKEALGPERVLIMEQEVQEKINAQKIPIPEPAPLPWQEAAEITN